MISGLRSQVLYPAPWQCFAACQRTVQGIQSAATQAVAGASFPAWAFPPLHELPHDFLAFFMHTWDDAGSGHRIDFWFCVPVIVFVAFAA